MAGAGAGQDYFKRGGCGSVEFESRIRSISFFDIEKHATANSRWSRACTRALGLVKVCQGWKGTTSCFTTPT
ncbi:hypothetical protein YC2023_024699 [Brassica napus]